MKNDIQPLGILVVRVAVPKGDEPPAPQDVLQAIIPTLLEDEDFVQFLHSIL